MVEELKVRFLVISLILPVFHQIDPPGENIKHHLCIDRKNKWPSVKARLSSVWKLNLTELTEKYPKYNFAWFLLFLFSFLIQDLLRYRIFKWKVIFKVIVLLLLIENLAFWGEKNHGYNQSTWNHGKKIPHHEFPVAWQWHFM